MNRLVIYVHGALSTPRSFAFIKQSLPDTVCYDFEYDIRKEAASNIADRLAEFTTSCGKSAQLTYITHSYGGVLAVEAVRRLGTAALEQDVLVTSMSTPYAGSSIASLMKLLKPSSQFFANIGRYNAFMLKFSASPLPCPVKGIITTAGAADWITEPNDGVVSVGSQLHYEADPLWSGVKLDANHFEVLLHPRAYKIIEKVLTRKLK